MARLVRAAPESQRIALPGRARPPSCLSFAGRKPGIVIFFQHFQLALFLKSGLRRRGAWGLHRAGLI